MRFKASGLRQNLVETILSPWLIEPDCYAQWRIQGEVWGNCALKVCDAPLNSASLV